MECMSSQKKTSSCDQACSHVGLRNSLVLLSFAICILFIWNICLQLKTYSNSVSLNGCISINEAKKNAFKNCEPKNLENKFMQSLSRKRRSSRLRSRVTNLEEQVRSLEAAVMKKIVHLRMNQEMNDTVLYSRVDNFGHCPGNSRTPCMRWDTPNAEFQYMFDYVKDGYNKPVAIKVLSPGLYTVYAQLMTSTRPSAQVLKQYDPWPNTMTFVSKCRPNWKKVKNEWLIFIKNILKSKHWCRLGNKIKYRVICLKLLQNLSEGAWNWNW